MAPSSALPIGATRVVSELQPIPVDPALPGSGLLNSVLALLAPANADESERYDEEMLDLHVIGYLVVCVRYHELRPVFSFSNHISMFRTGLDIPNKKMTVLSPSPGSLTGKTAIIGSFEWTEQV
jgi:polyribonucleotide 5'-hydroxyl-kinase